MPDRPILSQLKQIEGNLRAYVKEARQHLEAGDEEGVKIALDGILDQAEAIHRKGGS